VLLLITLGAFVAIAAFSSAMVAAWLSAIPATGVLCGWIAKDSLKHGHCCCGRHYERFADHAVAIARQVSFLVTGLPPGR
jgi:hypothetical protein